MKKSQILLIGVTSSLALAAISFAPSIAKNVLGGADYASGTWVHYAQKDATKTEKGIREYWIMCGSGTHQFTAPEGVTAVEADAYDTTGFRADDDRWITPVVVDAQEVVMTDATKALNLGAYSDMSVTSIKSGTLALGTDASALDVSGFAADHSDDGVREVVAYGVKDNKGYAVFTDTTFVTATIATADAWKSNVIPAATNTTIYGYYKVTADLSLSYVPTWISGWDKAIFSGTIDGGNHKITLGQGTYGQFYVLNGATLKNMTFHNNWWRRVATGYCLFANKSIASNFENLTFDVPVMGSGETDDYSPAANYGYLFNNGGVQRNAFKNCSWDFGDYDLPCLLSHSNNNTDTNTFENCTLKCKAFSEILSTASGSIVAVSGLSVEITEAVDISGEMDRADIDLSGESYSVSLPVWYNGIEVIDAYINVNGTNYSLGTDLSNLQIPDAVKNDKEHHGENTLFVKYHYDSSKIKTIKVPVTLVTKLIATPADLREAIPAKSGTVYGYYKATANLDLNTADKGWSDLPSAASAPTFAGTFNGNGVTITSKSRLCGIFGDIKGGTVKNFTVTDGWSYGGNDGGSAVLSRDMQNAKIENVTVNATGWANRSTYTSSGTAITAQNYGWINTRVCQNVSFTNCNFNFGTPSTCKVLTLLGTHPSCVNITFSNSTFTCNNYYCLYKSSYTNTVTTTQEGLTITGTCDYVAE